jgi:hypothetical protein
LVGSAAVNPELSIPLPDHVGTSAQTPKAITGGIETRSGVDDGRDRRDDHSEQG